MKYLAILLVIVSVSCSSVILDNPMDLDTAWQITADFKGMKDTNGENWKTPAEFELDGGGDCEDFATYLLYLLGPESKARMAVIMYGKVFHAIVQLEDGTLIEPQIYKAYWYGAPLWTLSYDTVMMFAGASKSISNTEAYQ